MDKNGLYAVKITPPSLGRSLRMGQGLGVLRLA